MYVTVTSLQLRGPLKFFLLSYLAMKIVQQLKADPNCLGYKSNGFWTLHFTMSLWKDEESLKQFSKRGAHLDGMKRSREMAAEIRTYTYPADQLPDWGTAKKILREKGKVIAF